MSPAQALAFVRIHGVVLQSARGPVPSLAEAIAGGPIRGSWWGHPRAHEIFHVTEAIRESPDVLICKLVDGKITYVHKRLWPALVRLSPRFKKAQLARTWNEHTSSGAHRSRSLAFPRWVPDRVMKQAQRLTEAKAEMLFAPWLSLSLKKPKGPA